MKPTKLFFCQRLGVSFYSQSDAEWDGPAHLLRNPRPPCRTELASFYVTLFETEEPTFTELSTEDLDMFEDNNQYRKAAQGLPFMSIGLNLFTDSDALVEANGTTSRGVTLTLQIYPGMSNFVVCISPFSSLLIICLDKSETSSTMCLQHR